MIRTARQLSETVIAGTLRKLLSLDSFSLKVIALVIMTIDHVAAYLFEIPAVGENEVLLHAIGRAAAPIFLFVVTESARHTSNRVRYILRLYVANLVCAGALVISNLLFSGYLGIHETGNIFPMLMYTVIFIHFIEGMRDSVRGGKPRRFTAYLLGLAAVCLLPVLVFALTIDNPGMSAVLTDLSTVQVGSVYTMIQALFPSVLLVEYTPLFILLGLAWYWLPNKVTKLAALCALSVLAHFPMGLDTGVLVSFFGVGQQWMILAAPFIALYNGSRGRGLKYLFYAYYIAHPYVLILIGAGLQA